MISIESQNGNVTEELKNTAQKSEKNYKHLTGFTVKSKYCKRPNVECSNVPNFP